MSSVSTSTPEGSAPAVTAGVVVAGTALLLPFGAVQLGVTLSFMPALVATVTSFDLLAVCLLIGGYRDKGDRRLLIMAASYAASLVLMAGYALAFPGAVSQRPLLALAPSTAPYLYLAWHGGFPLLLALSSAPWPARFLSVTSTERRARTALLTMAAALGGSITVVVLGVVASPHLPALIVGLDTTRMTRLTAPVVLPLVLAALLLSYRGTRERCGPERWCTVTILVCLCDLLLTYIAAHRFSLGWYGGRVLTLVAAGVVVVAMLASFRRLSALAEHNAAHDPLTGLANRRSAYASLEQLIILARRSARPLGVVSLDLDHFKLVNDRHGHETGDMLLATVAQVLRRSCRAGDVVARVGGEEFLVLLPSADERGTWTVAESLRKAVSSITLPDLPQRVTGSLGITTLQVGDSGVADLLRRVDEALYEAKHAGRDRVVVAGQSVRPRLRVLDTDAHLVAAPSA